MAALSIVSIAAAAVAAAGGDAPAAARVYVYSLPPALHTHCAASHECEALVTRLRSDAAHVDNPEEADYWYVPLPALAHPGARAATLEYVRGRYPFFNRTAAAGQARHLVLYTPREDVGGSVPISDTGVDLLESSNSHYDPASPTRALVHLTPAGLRDGPEAARGGGVTARGEPRTYAGPASLVPCRACFQTGKDVALPPLDTPPALLPNEGGYTRQELLLWSPYTPEQQRPTGWEEAGGSRGPARDTRLFYAGVMRGTQICDADEGGAGGSADGNAVATGAAHVWNRLRTMPGARVLNYLDCQEAREHEQEACCAKLLQTYREGEMARAGIGDSRSGGATGPVAVGGIAALRAAGSATVGSCRRPVRANMAKEMRRAVFCVVPRTTFGGDEATLLHAALFGCLPVFVGGGRAGRRVEPPLSGPGGITWEEFSLSAALDEVEHLPGRLAALDSSDVERMQAAMAKARVWEKLLYSSLYREPLMSATRSGHTPRGTEAIGDRISAAAVFDNDAVGVLLQVLGERAKRKFELWPSAEHAASRDGGAPSGRSEGPSPSLASPPLVPVPPSACKGQPPQEPPPGSVITAPSECVRVFFYHVEKTGGTTVRNMFRRLGVWDDVVYWGANTMNTADVHEDVPCTRASTEGGTVYKLAKGERRCSLARLLTDIEKDPSAHPRVFVELHPPQPMRADDKFLSRIAALRDRERRSGSACKTVLLTIVREPRAFYVSYYHHFVQQYQAPGARHELAYGSAFHEWAIPNLQTLTLLHDPNVGFPSRAKAYKVDESTGERTTPLYLARQAANSSLVSDRAMLTALNEGLELFDIVGTTEQFDATMLLLSDATGLRHVAYKRANSRKETVQRDHSEITPAVNFSGLAGPGNEALAPSPDEARALVDRISPFDQEMYARWSGAFAERIAALGPTFEERLRAFVNRA